VGSYYFYSDKELGGKSVITTGTAKDGVVTLEGNLVSFDKGMWLGYGCDFNAESLKLMKKTKGFRLKILADNQYYMVSVKTKAVKDYAYFQKIVFLPDRESVVTIMFGEVEQLWGEKVLFDRYEVTGLQISTYSQSSGEKVRLLVRDTEAITEDEPNPTVTKKIMKGGALWLFDDKPFGGTSRVTLNRWEQGFMQMDGVVTSVLKWGFLAIEVKADEANRKLLSKARGVSFRLSGDGKEYWCFLIMTSVKDNDWYRVRVKADPAFRTVTVLYKDLKQEGWGKPVPFDRNAITGISFQTIGQPLESVSIKAAEIEIIPE
jgi:hypothetical protein